MVHVCRVELTPSASVACAASTARNGADRRWLAGRRRRRARPAAESVRKRRLDAATDRGRAHERRRRRSGALAAAPFCQCRGLSEKREPRETNRAANARSSVERRRREPAARVQ